MLTSGKHLHVYAPLGLCKERRVRCSFSFSWLPPPHHPAGTAAQLAPWEPGVYGSAPVAAVLPVLQLHLVCGVVPQQHGAPLLSQPPSLELWNEVEMSKH
jgi:hypothetical protein